MDPNRAGALWHTVALKNDKGDWFIFWYIWICYIDFRIYIFITVSHVTKHATSSLKQTYVMG